MYEAKRGIHQVTPAVRKCPRDVTVFEANSRRGICIPFTSMRFMLRQEHEFNLALLRPLQA